jgi:oxygen-dependent protoporphyrinogen oxidase
MYDAIVVGGGVAGLTIAYRLLKAGRQVVCLEADATAGGCVRTDRVGGLLCERGAQNVLEEPDGPVCRLARDLGIGDTTVYPREKGNYIAWREHLHAMPGQLHRVLSPGGMIRAARGLLVASAPNGVEESIATWARRRFGDEVALRVIDPMIAGICAGDPERLSLDAVFPDLGKLERKHRSLLAAAFGRKSARRHHYSFRNGMGALTEALSNRLGRFLHTGIKAVAVAADGSGYRIDAEDSASGSPTFQLRSRSVVIAVPAAIAARMMSTLNPALGRLLDGIESAPAVTAGIAFSPADFISHPPRGYGFVRPHCEGARLLGCLFPSSAFEGTAPPGVVHLRVLAGGRRDPEACKLSDDELIDLVRVEMGAVLGLRPNAQPSVCHVVRHAIAFPQYESGHLERVRQIEAALMQHRRMHLVGNSYHGLSVSKVVERAEHLSASILQSRAAA